MDSIEADRASPSSGGVECYVVDVWKNRIAGPENTLCVIRGE